MAHTSRRFFHGAAIGAGVLTFLFTAWLVFNWGGARATVVFDDLGEMVAAAIAAAGCAVAACRSRGRNRVAWSLMALATGAWAAGEAAWSYYEVLRNVDVPDPSLADVGFLAFVPFGVAGLLLFAAPARRERERARALVDGLVMAGSFFFVSWEFVLGPIYAASRLTPLAEAVTLAYPVGDVTMITIGAFALSRVRADSRFAIGLVAAGILSLSLADSTYAFLSATSYYTGNAYDAGWVAGFLLIFLASLRSRPHSLHHESAGAPIGTVRMLIPNAAFLTAILAGTWILFSQGELDTVGLAIAVVLSIFTLASNLLVQFDNRALLRQALDSERALGESRRSLLQVVDNAPVILFAFDAEGTLGLMTGSGLTMLADGSDRLVGRHYQEILKDWPDFAAAVEAALAGRPGQLVVSLEHGEMDVRLLPVIEDGQVVTVSGVAIDISEKRRAEAARRESEAKSRFLATMTHELRTPLNSILGFADLLMGERRGPLNDAQKRYVTNVLSSGSHLLALITDLLDLSRVSAGEVEINQQRVDLQEAIQEAAARIRPMAERKQQQLTVGFGGPEEVLADPLRLQQVLLNLLSNAVKFTLEGGSIEVGAAAVAEGVEVSVRDTGVGIPAEHLEKVFDEYAQLESRATSDGSTTEGVGLGLPVSRRLAELMQGTLRAESEVGKGSIFRLRLPVPGPRPSSAATGGPAEVAERAAAESR